MMFEAQMKSIGHLKIESLKAFIDNSVETEQVPDKREHLPSLENLVHEYTELDLGQGSVILVLLNNSKLFISHVFAISLAGYVPALVPPSTPTVRVNAIAECFSAKAILKNKIFKNAYAKVSDIKSLGAVEIALICQNNNPVTNQGELILTTSGTSGFSSGCVFDFSALLRNAKKHADVIQLNEKDKVLVNLPMFYSYAFVAQMLATLVRQAQLIISAPPFNTQQYLKDIKYYGVTVSATTPLIIKELGQNTVKFPPSLRALSVGGDKLAEDDLQSFLLQSFDKELYLTYGISEAGPRVSTLAVHKEPINKWSSVGQLLPNTQAQLLNKHYRSDCGELLIHSDTLVKYRLGNPDKPLFIELDGYQWLRTGDLFHIDDDGYLFYRDRLCDFILLNGEKVNLADIKRHVTKKFNALSTQVRLIKEKSLITGFGVDILMPNDAEFNSEIMVKSLKRDLKLYERPQFIEITRSSENTPDRYK